MSYDMDIWNAEEEYFSDNLEISMNGISGPFFNILKYLERHEEAVESVKNFMEKSLTKNSIQKNKKTKNQQQESHSDNSL